MHENLKMEKNAAIEAFPLVSIIVLCYNSSETVQETLDSLLVQDYPAVEIIISDDGSTDDTAAVVEVWKEKHQQQFRRVVFLASASNQGICANVSKGYAEAAGEWIKPIAGDDFILPGAIAQYMELAISENHAVIISKMIPFNDASQFDMETDKVIPFAEDIEIIKDKPENLLSALRMKNIIPAPAILLRRSDYEAVGGIDRAFFHLDDWPLWINLLEAGKTFGWLPQPLIAYRISLNAVSAAGNATGVNRQFLRDHHIFYRKYQLGSLGNLQRWDKVLEMWRFELASGKLRSYPRLYKMTGIVRLLSPLYLLARLKAR